MKKLLLFVLLLYSFPSFSKYRVVFEEDCPKDVVCNETEIMGDDGKCYPCNSEEHISIQCIGPDEAERICPNRLLGSPSVFSYLTCPDGDEEVESQVRPGRKYCDYKCKEGYKKMPNGGCLNEKTGSAYVIDR